MVLSIIIQVLDIYISMRDKVIYRHLKPNGEVFYIGIGSLKRAFSDKGRNRFWERVAIKCGYEVQILKSNLSWEEAAELEIYLISFYGRRDLGTGTLVNLTEGGDGVINLSDESRKRLSDSKKGKDPWNKGLKSNVEPWNKNLKGYMGSNKTSFKKGNKPWNDGIVGHQTNQYSILKANQVLEIRDKFKPRIYTRKMLADEYNISEATIKDIVIRKTWKHI